MAFLIWDLVLVLPLRKVSIRLQNCIEKGRIFGSVIWNVFVQILPINRGYMLSSF